MSRRANGPAVRSFEPVVGDRPHTLILGSAPGIRSLEDVEYYAHPRNAFWPIMAQIAAFNVDLPYADRLTALTRAGFALWDVLAECERRTSLDSDIVESSIVPNEIAPLLAERPTIRLVAFNGGKSEASFRRYVAPDLDEAGLDVALVRLPSTSPAYAAMRYPEKLAAWESTLGVVPRPRAGD